MHKDIHCESYYDSIGTITWPILATDVVSKERICVEKLGICKKPVIEEIDLKTVVDGILKEKPSKIKDDNFINNMYADIGKSESERNVLKAVHLSDVHMDFKYKQGTLADCDDIICCREETGMPKHGQIVAGKWGGY